MDIADWNTVLNTGVEEIDTQHRGLVQLAQELAAAIHSKEGQETLKDLVARLRHYSVEHFAAETRIMQQMRFPEIREHLAEHRRLSNMSRQFQDDFYRQQGVPAENVGRFMKHWLFDHILKWDMRLAAHIKAVRDGTFKPEEQPPVPDAGASDGEAQPQA